MKNQKHIHHFNKLFRTWCRFVLSVWSHRTHCWKFFLMPSLIIIKCRALLRSMVNRLPWRDKKKTNDLDRPPTTVAKLPGQNLTAVSFPNIQSQDKSRRVGFRDIRRLSPHKFRMDICGPNTTFTYNYWTKLGFRVGMLLNCKVSCT